jgi:multiple sugar transport system ATP-binding protein
MENLGAEFLYHFDLTGTDANSFIVRAASSHNAIHEGDIVRLTFDPALCHIFGPDGRRVEKTPVLLSGDEAGRPKHGSIV